MYGAESEMGMLQKFMCTVPSKSMCAYYKHQLFMFTYFSTINHSTSAVYRMFDTDQNNSFIFRVNMKRAQLITNIKPK